MVSPRWFIGNRLLYWLCWNDRTEDCFLVFLNGAFEVSLWMRSEAAAAVVAPWLCLVLTSPSVGHDWVMLTRTKLLAKSLFALMCGRLKSGRCRNHRVFMIGAFTEGCVNWVRFWKPCQSRLRKSLNLYSFFGSAPDESISFRVLICFYKKVWEASTFPNIYRNIWNFGYTHLSAGWDIKTYKNISSRNFYEG